MLSEPLFDVDQDGAILCDAGFELLGEACVSHVPFGLDVSHLFPDDLNDGTWAEQFGGFSCGNILTIHALLDDLIATTGPSLRDVC